MVERKVQAAALGGSIATVLVAVAGALGLDLDPAVGAAIATIVSALLGYIARSE